MKIYTKVVIDLKTDQVIEQESYEYQGPIAQCISFGKQESKSEPTQLPTWSPEQQQVFQTLWPKIMEGLGKGGVPSYPGQMSVPRTPEEQNYFNLADPLVSSRMTEDLYQQGIRAPAMREWEQFTKPEIQESYAGPGYWGSARAEGVAQGAENLATNLAGQRAQLAYADEQQRRAVMEKAAPYSREIQQEKIMGDFQRWLSGETVGGKKMTAYSPFMQLAFQLLGLTPFTYGQKSESTGFNLGIMSGYSGGKIGG